MLAARITVSGRVQGVGFRWWATNQARQVDLVGHVANLPDGRVEILAQGRPDAVRVLVRRATEDLSTTGRPGRVDDFTLTWIDPDPTLAGFGYL